MADKDAAPTIIPPGKRDAWAPEETGPAPRYLHISQILRRRIETGGYPIDSSIPTEAELCAEFSASRFTVREALRLLVENGMIGRRRGSGSFVISTEPRTTFVQSMRSLSELFQYALDTDFEITGRHIAPLDAETAEILVADPGEEWLRIDGVRWTKGKSEAICFTRVHVDARFAPLLDDLVDLATPIYAAVEMRSGEPIVEAMQELRAAPMSHDVSRLVGAPDGAWALLVTRRYIGRDGATMVCSMNWHPAERFRYTMRLQRGEAPA